MTRNPDLPVEAPMNPGKVRSDAESACADGLAVDYAFELARIALAALPECSTLDMEDFRNEAVMLGQCYRLGGDRLIAGEAHATLRKLERALRLEQMQELQWLFVGLGETRASQFLAALDGGSPYLDAPTGMDADHAEISGQVVYFDRDVGAVGEVADISLGLLRQAGEFVIDTFKVSSRRPIQAAAGGSHQ